MAIISDTFTISHSGEPGDGNFSLTNRYLYALKEKLLEHGFNMVHENSVNINTQGKRYLLSLGGASGVLLEADASSVSFSTGIINGNSIAPSVNIRTFSVTGTNITTFNCFFSDNFYFIRNTSTIDVLIAFFKTNYGWCPCSNSGSFFVNINKQYYYAYRALVGNNLGHLNLDNNHVLYSLSFIRQTVPGTGTSAADRRLDDTIKYTGVAFQRPDTLNQLSTNTMYKINDTNETFYHGSPLGLIYFS